MIATYSSVAFRHSFSILRRKIGGFIFGINTDNQVEKTLNRKFSNFKNPNVSETFINELRKILNAKNVNTSIALREQYGMDEGYHSSSPPDVVVFAETTDEVSIVASCCNKYNVPLIPHGAGTGIEHGVGAIHGGVCVDSCNMSSILEVNENDFDCTVEAGVTRQTLNSYLRSTGLMFPVDPGADATLGGMAATGASGTNAVRYGTMKENVLNMEVVLADGSVIHTAGPNRRARKSAAGYNLTELFVGSEGTLGVITKVTLKLHAVPQTMVSAVCSFPSVREAVDTVVHTLQCNIPLARIEFLDEVSMAMSNEYSELDYPVKPSLFLEFHGSEESVKMEAEQVEEISSSNGGSNFVWAQDLETRNKLWKARHQIYYAVLAQKPGYKCVTTDVCVPISKLTEMVIKTKEDIKASGVIGAVLGHVGDGNFHTQLLFDPQNEPQFEVVCDLECKINQRALSMNGTCTGEHGIGVGKIELLEEEFGVKGVDVMMNIKKALDPKNLMNPGKLFKPFKIRS